MKADDCTAFLRWALPRMGLRWGGFRKVRRQVCKRLGRRLAELELESLDDYRTRLDEDTSEWSRLDAMCRITISRFFRDRGIFEALTEHVLPMLAEEGRRQGRAVEIWSAGCGSGEEPYSLAILWRLKTGPHLPGVDCNILATDAGQAVLERAREGAYPISSLKDLPSPLTKLAFERENDLYRLRTQFREAVRFESADVRQTMPSQRFDLILCRNLAFTYFAPGLQSEILDRFVDRLRSGGGLVIGSHERLPGEHPALDRWDQLPCIYRLAEDHS